MATTIKLRDVNPVVLDHNLGLGDPTPDEKIVVTNGSIKLSDSGDGQGIKFSSYSSNKNKLGLYWINDYNNADTTLWKLLNDEDSVASNDLNLRNTAGNSVLRVTQDGKIGFGIEGALQARFHIGGSMGGEIRLSNSSIGDDSSSGTSVKAHTDKHFYINNIENFGGIRFQTQTSNALSINSSQNVSVGGIFEYSSPESRFVIGKTNIAGGASEGLLHLHGKFDQSTLDATDRVAIRTTLYNSGDTGRIDDPIRFASNETVTHTFLNQGNGSVGIGAGVTNSTGPDGTLEIYQGGDSVVTKVRVFAKDADSYISFGDNNSNWYAGVDQSQDSGFVIGNGSGAPSSGNEGLCIATNGRVGINIEPSDTHLTKDFVVRGEAKFYEDDGGIERGIILSYSSSNDTGVIDTPNSTTGLEFWIGGARKSKLSSAGAWLIGDISSSATWGSPASLEVDGPILARGNTVSSAGFLFREDSNTGMLNSAANTLDFFTTGKNRLQINSSGKLTIGENKKPPVRHYEDYTESATTVTVKATVDHSADVVLYSVSLDDIEEDDIIIINANWGVNHSLGHTPRVHYGFIAAVASTTDYGDAEEDGSGVGEFVKLIGIQENDVTQMGYNSQSTSVSYKFVADDFNDARKYINFVVYANHSSEGTMTFDTSGRMTITQIRGLLSD